MRVEDEVTKEITSLEELRKLRLADEGYIVITDAARPAIVHKLNARCISIDSFNVKVTVNRGKQGKYYWVDTVATAARKYEAKRCKTCKPELHLVFPSTFDA
jgi:hypothetical protein